MTHRKGNKNIKMICRSNKILKFKIFHNCLINLKMREKYNHACIHTNEYQKKYCTGERYLLEKN